MALTPVLDPSPAHLLQHCLLGKGELLEPILLVLAGGVQVVGVHLRDGPVSGWLRAGQSRTPQRGQRLTRSTVFFLLVSARGPATKASHCSCCSAGSSARTKGNV